MHVAYRVKVTMQCRPRSNYLVVNQALYTIRHFTF